MESKPIKEEIPDKDYQSTTPAEPARRNKNASSKERRSPEADEPRSDRSPSSAAVAGNGSVSPANNHGNLDSLSPPLPESSGSRAPLARLRRFLSTLAQFAADIGADTAERVRSLIHSLLTGSMSVEEFQSLLQETTNYPLRASVPPFLRALVPLAQRDLLAAARHSKQTPLQYIRCHEQLIFESPYGGEATDIFASGPAAATPLDGAAKRRASDPFYDPPSLPQTNGTHHATDSADYPPPPKRLAPPGLLLNPSPLLFPLQTHAHLFDYSQYHPSFHGGSSSQELLAGSFERAGGIAVRDNLGGSFSEQQRNSGNSLSSLAGGSASSSGSGSKSDEEWRNINTMLNCILSMVEKTKRALAILQQRGSGVDSFPTENADIKRAASEIMAATVRQTEERVAEVRRRAEDAVNQVKRQAVLELQRAVSAAESKALELVAAERGKMERLLAEARRAGGDEPASSRDGSPAPGGQNSCWNCGRKAQETCSGCNAARYCGAFCQHKDWENHHQVCCGRDQKPPSVLATSPPSSTLPKPPLPLPLARSSTPLGPAPLALQATSPASQAMTPSSKK